MHEGENSIPRRTFLKAAAILGLALAVQPLITGEDPNQEKGGKTFSPPTRETVGQKENNLVRPENEISHSDLNNLDFGPEYDLEETKKIVEYIKNKYDLNIFFPESGPNGVQNLPWRTSELEILKNTLDSLPEKLTKNSRFPTQITLSKFKELEKKSFNGIFLSGYGDRSIVLTISSLFDAEKEAEGIEKDMFETQGGFLSGAITHEITHSYLESDPNILNEWQNLFGWYQNLNGSWSNWYPEKIIHEANAEKYPWEDFVVSVSVFKHNYHLLSTDRLNFLIKRFFNS